MVKLFDDTNIKAIADKIREKTETDDKYKVSEMAAQINRVHENGYRLGLTEGQQAEYNKFWDVFQNHGNRELYNYAFRGYGWDKTNFFPKYDIKPKRDASYMFYNWEDEDGSTNPEAERINLKEHLEECGVSLDTSGVTRFASMFAYGERFLELPIIDCSGITTAESPANEQAVFYACRNLRTIVGIVFPENLTEYRNWFNSCLVLENLTAYGTIAGSGLDFHWSTKLSKASHISIINAVIADKSISITFSQTAVDNAFETSGGAADGSTSEEWLNLLATKPNCTVSLA